MKVIALLPFKNESANLNFFMKRMAPHVDAVIGYDDESIDSSRAIFTSLGGILLRNRGLSFSNGDEPLIRQELLDEGRRLGGTHFYCLDVDEFLTKNFSQKSLKYLTELLPGQFLRLNWINLWGGKDSFCSKGKNLEPSLKDFVFRDQKDLMYIGKGFHQGRTPILPGMISCIDVPLEDGAVIHTQYCNLDAMRIKQAWYQCLELLNGGYSFDIVDKYEFTKGKRISLSPVLENWGLDDCSPFRRNQDWRLGEIQKLFDAHGPAFFEQLDIWDIPELFILFRLHQGRDPEKFLAKKVIRKIKFKCQSIWN